MRKILPLMAILRPTEVIKSFLIGLCNKKNLDIWHSCKMGDIWILGWPQHFQQGENSFLRWLLISKKQQTWEQSVSFSVGEFSVEFWILYLFETIPQTINKIILVNWMSFCIILYFYNSILTNVLCLFKHTMHTVLRWWINSLMKWWKSLEKYFYFQFFYLFRALSVFFWSGWKVKCL